MTPQNIQSTILTVLYVALWNIPLILQWLNYILDVDRCQAADPVCFNGATCQNSNGGYLCTCTNGFTGTQCKDGKC